MQQNCSVKSVYIHVPFCRNICSYCDFCKNYFNRSLSNKYIEALKDEFSFKYKNEKISTIYIGGGTPSCLSLDNLRKLFDITSSINLNNDYEFTFECNYEDINEDLLKILKTNKVNRLSIGIESFNEKYASVLNRRINKKEMIQKISIAKKYFDNINLDLMYALPNQTIDELEADLNTFLKMDVKHISIYSLIIEEHTALFINGAKELDDELQARMYEKIIKTLKNNGFIHYEISNFAKPGFESKHNLTYWHNEEYYGLGAGASGFTNKIRYDNTKSLKNYIDKKNSYKKEFIKKDQMILDEVMLGLRLTKGINKLKFKEKYQFDIRDAFKLDDLLRENLLKENDEFVYIPEDKLFISNGIIAWVLDNYLLN